MTQRIRADEPVLIVMVDQVKANLLNATAGQISIEAHLEIDIDERDYEDFGAYALGASVQGGLFEKMVAGHRTRFFQAVVEQIEALFRDKDYQWIAFGGAEASALMVKNMLPKRLQAQVVGVLPIPMNTDGKTILERVIPVAQAFERAYEVRLVNEMVQMAKSGGRAVLGMQPVLAALDQQRVELLMIPLLGEDQVPPIELPPHVFDWEGQIEWVIGEAAEKLSAEGGIAAKVYYTL